MVTLVIVFEELNRVVSLSPTKERMKAFSLARHLDPYQDFKSLISREASPHLSRWGEGNRFWRLAMRADMGKYPDCCSDH
jgi:hypothetical protein